MASDAKFSVNADPFSNGGFDATNGQVLTLQLEASPALDILSVTYSVVASSKGAPTLTFSDPSPQPPTNPITVTMPASGVHTYLIAATVQRSDGTDTKVRAIAIRFANGSRKIAASETTQYDDQFGWTDAINRIAEDGTQSYGGVEGSNLTDSDQNIDVTGGTYYELPGPTTLTTDRDVTFDTTGANTGQLMTIVRLDTSFFTLDVVNGGPGAGTIHTFIGGQEGGMTARFDGTNWKIVETWTL